MQTEIQKQEKINLNFKCLEITSKNEGNNKKKILDFLNKLTASKITHPISYLFFLNSASRYIADIFLVEHDIDEIQSNKILIFAPEAILENFILHIKNFDLRKEVAFKETNYKVYYTNFPSKTCYKDPREEELGINLGYFEILEEKTENALNMKEYKSKIIENEIAEFENFEYARSIILEYGKIGKFISHNKGCYPGQELMHRINVSGEIRKTIGLLSKKDDRIIKILEETETHVLALYRKS